MIGSVLTEVCVNFSGLVVCDEATSRNVSSFGSHCSHTRPKLSIHCAHITVLLIQAPGLDIAESKIILSEVKLVMNSVVNKPMFFVRDLSES